MIPEHIDHLNKTITESAFFKTHLSAIVLTAFFGGGILLIQVSHLMSNQLASMSMGCGFQSIMGGGESLQCFLGTNLFSAYPLVLVAGVISLVMGGIVSIGVYAQWDEINKLNLEIEADPENPETYNKRAGVWKKRKESDKAIADYTKAIELDVENIHAHHMRGHTHLSNHRFDEALADYERLIEINPNYAPAYNGRAVVLQEKGKLQEALVDFEKATALDPTVPLFKQNLARLKLRLSNQK